MKRTLLLFLGILFALQPAVQQASAQGTAFRYQGVLSSGGGPGAGNYDFIFRLFNAATGGGQIGTDLAVNNVPVQSGLFEVIIDFGAGAFDGAPRWLETEVRKGNGAFTLLSPRQRVLPTPYAIFSANAAAAVSAVNATTAGTAGTVGANGVDGPAVQNGAISAAKISSGQVVKSLNGLADAVTISAGPNVTLTPSGNDLQIAASSSGGLAFQSVSGTAHQAQPNSRYLLVNSAPVTVTLPATPSLGDLVRLSSMGAGGWGLALNSGQSVILPYAGGNVSIWDGGPIPRGWQSAASSDDGTKLVAVASFGPGFSLGRIYTSTDSGLTWTARDSNRGWVSVASSADGVKLVAVVEKGQVYTSTDSGVTWSPRDTTRDWACVASSADGVKLVAGVGNKGQIYTSTDSGVTWSPHESGRVWRSVASSADGSKLVAVDAGGGRIYTSIDSGVTWTPRESNASWVSVSSSADGVNLVAAVSGGQLYTSTDSGVTWTARESSRNWSSTASSTDGTKLIASVSGGEIYASTDSGANWTPHESTRNWKGVTSSADGTRLLAVVNAGHMFSSTDSGVTWSSGGPLSSFTGPQYSTLELLYVGSGTFLPVNSLGGFGVQ